MSLRVVLKYIQDFAPFHISRFVYWLFKYVQAQAMSVVGYTIFKIYYLESNIDAWFTIGTLKLLASK